MVNSCRKCDFIFGYTDKNNRKNIIKNSSHLLSFSVKMFFQKVNLIKLYHHLKKRFLHKIHFFFLIMEADRRSDRRRGNKRERGGSNFVLSQNIPLESSFQGSIAARGCGASSNPAYGAPNFPARRYNHPAELETIDSSSGAAPIYFFNQDSYFAAPPLTIPPACRFHRSGNHSERFN